MVSYGEGRQLISLGCAECLANTLLCMKRKRCILFCKDVNSDILTFTKLVNCNKFF